MKTFATSLLIAVAQAGPDGAAIPASKVCITNSAGFVLNWYLDDMVTGEKSHTTDNYPIDQTQCNDVTSMIADVKENDLIEVYVKAILGTTNSVDSALFYSASAPAVTFTCTGTTLNFSCKLNGQDNFCGMSCEPGTKRGIIPIMSCFTEGFISQTIESDKLSAWGECRAKKTSACTLLESGLDDFFKRPLIKGIDSLKGLVTPLTDMATSCKTAWMGEAMGFGSWVTGTVEDPVSLGYQLTTAFIGDSSDQIANDLGEMINLWFSEKDYWGAGNNMALVLNAIFGAPSEPVHSNLFF